MIQSFKTMKKDIEEDSRNWNGFPCSRIYKLNRVKMAILPKAISRFNKIPIKIQTQFFTDNSQLYMEEQKALGS